MEFAQFDGILWLLLALGPLIFLQRSLHYEIQAVMLLLTRRPDVSMVVFSLVFFPGVVLHELSHYGMAKLLSVRTGKISLIPQPSVGGNLRLGYVETAKSDPLRDTIIGMAPLLSGIVVVAYIGIYRFQLPEILNGLRESGFGVAVDTFSHMYQQADFWLWFYLLVVISSMMLPSPSDRRSWAIIGLWLVVIVGVSLVAGAGSWLYNHAIPKVNQALNAIAVVFFISVVVHALLLPVFWLLHRFFSRVTGYDVRA